MPGRRELLAAAAGLALAAEARAQQRLASLSMFIPAGPGGGWDGLGRAIEQVARQAGLVGTFQFENVGGAGGSVGLPRFVGQRRGRPDALMVAGSIMVGATLTNRTPIGMKDVTPIARMTEEAGVVVVPASSEIRDLKGLLDALRANPGGVSVAGGSPAQAAILGAQVKAGISGLSEFAEQIKSGRMRALATTGPDRTDPAIPTLKESGVDVVMTNWRGVFAPPGIRAEAREKLVALMTEIHALPAWTELLKTRDWQDAFLTGDAFAAFLTEDVTKTEAVLKEIGLA